MAYSLTSCRFEFERSEVARDGEGKEVLWLHAVNYGTTLALELNEARALAHTILGALATHEESTPAQRSLVRPDTAERGVDAQS